MKMPKKSLLAVIAAFAVAPTAAFALPSPQCNQLCLPNRTACVEECYEGLTPTTCGDAGYWCYASDALTPPVTTASAQREEDALVCSEEHPAETQPGAVES
ncbi:hypothetical protein [Corallococcus sp. 4LFB]|uniref:hypothetical protein n=1 Tax=Corallococcus sp. 4LFB TaxID=3383249 RepID=UPI00397591CD